MFKKIRAHFDIWNHALKAKTPSLQFVLFTYYYNEYSVKYEHFLALVVTFISCTGRRDKHYYEKAARVFSLLTSVSLFSDNF